MKKSLVFALFFLLITSLPLHAQDDWKKGIKDICFVYSDTAKRIMQGRQHGFPIKKSLQKMEQEATKANMSPKDKEAFAYIVREAYAVPLYENDMSKETSYTEFEAKIYLWCESGMEFSD